MEGFGLGDMKHQPRWYLTPLNSVLFIKHFKINIFSQSTGLQKN